MSRNGSGVYSLPAGSTVTNGSTSDATDINTPLQDIETDLNTARPIVAGGTGATSASAARTNLGLVIGTDIQAFDAGLLSIAGLTTAANKMIYTTASDTYEVADLTAAGRALLDDADAAAQRTTLGLGDIATTDLIDEDDMASDTAAQAPTQQSVKAYVDAEVSGSATLIAAGSFDGTGTPAWNYRNGFGATITDNGTGDYTVAFDSAEADANYVVQVTAESAGAGVSNRQFVFAHTLTTSGFNIRVTDINGTAADRDGIHVTVHRMTWS